MARKKVGKKVEPARGGELVPQSGPALPPGYAELLEDLKARVRTAQLKAAVAVNREMIQLYWDIGRLIVERQEREGWGKGILDRLARDIQKAIPGLKELSPGNAWRMYAFYLFSAKGLTNLAQAARDLDSENRPQIVAEIPRFRHGAASVRRQSFEQLPDVHLRADDHGAPWLQLDRDPSRRQSGLE